MTNELIQLKNKYKQISAETISKMFITNPLTLGKMVYLNLKERLLNEVGQIDLFNIKEWDHECDIFSVSTDDKKQGAYMFYGNVLVYVIVEYGKVLAVRLENIRDSESNIVHQGKLKGEYDEEF